MKNYLELIDQETGENRYDISPIFSDEKAFSEMVGDFCELFSNCDIDIIAGIDALGFILGTAISIRLNKGFIPIRKRGKLSKVGGSVSFLDYSSTKKGLEIRSKPFTYGAKVLLVDDWIETGSQVKAAINLIESQDGEIIGITSIVANVNDMTNQIFAKYNCIPIVKGKLSDHLG